MGKFIAKHLVITTLLTVTLGCTVFGAIVRSRDTHTIVSKGEVMEWSSALAETLRTLDYKIEYEVQKKVEPILETQATTTQVSN